jgi:biopolymer transport protein ExbD
MMSSMSLFSLLFFALPAPLKMALIVMGGVIGGVRMNQVHVHQAHAADAAPLEVVPARKPAKVVQAVPVKPAKDIAPLVITVNSDGSFGMAGAKLSEEQLVQKLKAMAGTHPERKIELKADALTPYQMVVNAVKISKGAGLTNVSFASKPEAP